jgi:hypothetical protein
MQITPRVRCQERDRWKTGTLFDPPDDAGEHQEQGDDVELIKGRSCTADGRNMANGGNAVNAWNERDALGSGPVAAGPSTERDRVLAIRRS